MGDIMATYIEFDLGILVSDDLKFDFEFEVNCTFSPADGAVYVLAALLAAIGPYW